MSAKRDPADQRTEQEQRETEATVGWVGPGHDPAPKIPRYGKGFLSWQAPSHGDVSASL